MTIRYLLADVAVFVMVLIGIYLAAWLFGGIENVITALVVVIVADWVSKRVIGEPGERLR